MSPAGSPLRQLANRYRRGLILAIFLVVSSLFILFNGTPGVAKPQEIGLSIFGFFQGIISGTVHTAGEFGSSVVDLTDLQSRYQKASALVKKYEGDERTLVQLREENRRLREQLGFHQALPYFNVPVEIIGRDPSKVYSTLIVNKGYLDGIRKNLPVVATQNGVTGLVGKVNEVGLTSSVVQPILDANLFIAARVENTRHEGLVTGLGNNQEVLSMSYVKKEAQSEIHAGDLIVTAGIDSLYPADLLIGRVKTLTVKQYQTSLDIELEPILDFSRLEYVNILRSEP
jgi:rod shape-determining protein MreC